MCDINWSPKEHALAVSFFGGDLPVMVFEYQKQAKHTNAHRHRHTFTYSSALSLTHTHKHTQRHRHTRLHTQAPSETVQGPEGLYRAGRWEKSTLTAGTALDEKAEVGGITGDGEGTDAYHGASHETMKHTPYFNTTQYNRRAD